MEAYLKKDAFSIGKKQKQAYSRIRTGRCVDIKQSPHLLLRFTSCFRHVDGPGRFRLEVSPNRVSSIGPQKAHIDALYKAWTLLHRALVTAPHGTKCIASKDDKV